MAYKVGSLADLISGTRDASANNNIVYLPTQRKSVTSAAENFVKLNDESLCKKRPASETHTISQSGRKKSKLELCIVNEEELEDQEELQKSSRRTKKISRDTEKEARTIFVKNVPYTTNLKELKKLFEKYGRVETIRFRCAPQQDIRIPKKVTVIKKEFHSERTNICAFVRFHDQESVKNAMQANGILFNGYRIFVDEVMNKRVHDQKKAIFIGNLPFGAEENDLWEIYSKYGNITDIRIVRDKETGLGKGFAFVDFQCADSVELAISQKGIKLKDRELRVVRATKNPGAQQRSRLSYNRRVQEKGNGKNYKGNDKGFMHKQWKDKNVANKFKSSVKNDKMKHGGRVENKQLSFESGNKRNKVENHFQGQKMTDKKKKKKKINKNELKKKIIAKKLTTSGGKGKSSTK